ncbi:MAG TPA: Yip1 family protein [Bacillales bacterium]|nr:Yip1 family protein [Bacillales bacterium]
MEDKQVHHIHLFKGIMKPNEEFRDLREAEEVKGLGWRLVVLSVVNAIIAGVAGYVATQVLNITTQTSGKLNNPEMPQELVQGMAIGGAAIGGLVQPVIVMAIMALIFLIFFSDIGYKKLFAVELYLQLIGLIGGIVSGILMVVFRSGTQSFLNLGAITHLITDNAFINGFFGGISIFLIWKVYVQINAYRQASRKSSSSVAWTLIIINIVFMLILGGLALLGQQMTEFFQHMPQMQQPK